MVKKIIGGMLAGAALTAASPSLAATAVVGFSNTGSVFTNFTGDRTVGFTFNTANNISVTELGWFAVSGALNASHRVGIWSLAGTLLGSTTVMPGVAGVTGFRFASVSPISLNAGQQYFIGGTDLGSDGDNYRTGVSNLVMGNGITFLGSAVALNDPGFAFPSTVAANTGGRFGPNFVYNLTSAVPEPSTWMMMVFGFGIAGFAMRSRRRNVQVSFS